MDPASSERSRFREALADVPQKPSRGHCGNGFLHRPNAHVWCSVLLFHHRPRLAKDARRRHELSSAGLQAKSWSQIFVTLSTQMVDHDS